MTIWEKATNTGPQIVSDPTTKAMNVKPIEMDMKLRLQKFILTKQQNQYGKKTAESDFLQWHVRKVSTSDNFKKYL